MGTTRLVSGNTNGVGANGTSRHPVISADGRYVTFASDASDLVTGDSNGESDVFVRDLLLGTIALASVSCDAFGPGNAGSDFPSLSADGQSVAFLSLANNLAPGQFPAGRWQVFRRDMSAGTTTLVSMNTIMTGGSDDSATAVLISANGRKAVFVSAADDLGPEDQNGADDIFAWTAPEPVVTADLAVSMTPPEALAPFGAQLRYSVTVSNLGPAMATGVVLVDVVSGNTVINSVLVSQGSAMVIGATVFIQLGVIPAQGSATATLTVTPADFSFTNSASTAGSEGDSKPANNGIEQTVTCPSADVTIEQSYLPNPASVSAPINLTLTISNRGPGRATGLVVSNTLATELAYVSAGSSAGACTLNGHTVTCALGSLDPRGRATIGMVVQPTGPGTFPNLARLISATCDPILGNNTNAAFVQVNSVSRPILSIHSAGGNFILEWPAQTPPGFVLETTTNLTPSTVWSAVPNAMNPLVITNAPAERARFYRLRMP
jgi:uncharacterized repeat protein (TIGR01451 family)